MKRHFLGIGSALIILLGLTAPGRATENHWTGAAGDNQWTNTANWDLGVVPDFTQDVYIEETGTNTVVLNGSAEVGNFFLGSPLGSAALEIPDGSTLQCQGNVSIQLNAVLDVAGQFSSDASLLNYGSVNWNAGSNAVFGTVYNDGTISCASSLMVGASCRFTNHNLFIGRTNLLITGSGFFINQGQLVLQSGCTVHSVGIWNQGTLLAPENSGTVSLLMDCPFQNQGALVAGANAVLELRTTNFNWCQLHSGTVFDGDGIVRLSGSSMNDEFYCLGTQTLDGTVEVEGPLISGDGNFGGAVWNGPGLLRWKSGGMGSLTFGSNLQVEISGAGNVSGNCTNLGTVRWLSGASLISGSGFFVNQGQLVFQSDCTFNSVGIWNQGTMLAPENSGTVSLLMDCAFVNQGGLVAEANAVLELRTTNNNWCQFHSGTVFDGDGIVRLAGCWSGCWSMHDEFDCTGTQTVDGTVEVDGPLISGDANFGGAVWNGPGLLRWKSGGIESLTFGSNLQVEMSGPGEKDVSGNCTNLGTVQWMGDSACKAPGGATFANNGLFLIETNGTWDPAVAFYNLAGGTLRQTAGTFSLGTLNNLGLVDFTKGFTALSGAFVLNPSSTYLMALGGRVPGQDFGQLSAQTLTANGSLMLVLPTGLCRWMAIPSASQRAVSPRDALPTHLCRL